MTRIALPKALYEATNGRGLVSHRLKWAFEPKLPLFFAVQAHAEILLSMRYHASPNCGSRRELLHLTLTYQLRSGLTGATVTPEVSRDLQTWSPDVVVVSEEQNGDGTTTITVRDSQPITSGEERYIRIRIEE